MIIRLLNRFKGKGERKETERKKRNTFQRKNYDHKVAKFNCVFTNKTAKQTPFCMREISQSIFTNKILKQTLFI